MHQVPSSSRPSSSQPSSSQPSSSRLASSPLLVALGLGANLGDRLATMQRAVASLRRLEHVRVIATSRVWETEPVGGPPQPHYLNAAVGVECTFSPLELLDATMAIEHDLGRERGPERFGPRTIDIDVLWIKNVECTESRLTVPHPRLLERAFALLPLLDVFPDARDPRTGLTLRLRDECDEGGVHLTSLSL